MSNDLLTLNLRQAAIWLDCIVLEQAADRIERLERALQAAHTAAWAIRDPEEAQQPAETARDQLLAALERAGNAESALRRLVDECDNYKPGWEERMQSCIDNANKLLAGEWVAEQIKEQP